MNTRPEAQEAYPTGSDREVLLYLMQQFDGEVWVCERCGNEEDTATMDSADYLRRYLAIQPPARVVSDEMVARAFNAVHWMRIATYPQEELRAALEAALSLPTGDAAELPEGLEACVQHGNSFLAMQTAGGRVVVTVPIQIAAAVKKIIEDRAYKSELHRAANKRAEGLSADAGRVVEARKLVEALWTNGIPANWTDFVNRLKLLRSILAEDTALQPGQEEL